MVRVFRYEMALKGTKSDALGRPGTVS